MVAHSESGEGTKLIIITPPLTSQEWTLFPIQICKVFEGWSFNVVFSREIEKKWLSFFSSAIER